MPCYNSSITKDDITSRKLSSHPTPPEQMILSAAGNNSILVEENILHNLLQEIPGGSLRDKLINLLKSESQHRMPYEAPSTGLIFTNKRS
jgi:hypothetical protein